MLIATNIAGVKGRSRRRRRRKNRSVKYSASVDWPWDTPKLCNQESLFIVMTTRFFHTRVNWLQEEKNVNKTRVWPWAAPRKVETWRQTFAERAINSTTYKLYIGTPDDLKFTKSLNLLFSVKARRCILCKARSLHENNEIQPSRNRPAKSESLSCLRSEFGENSRRRS